MRKIKLVMQTSIDGFTTDRNGKIDWMAWSWGDDWGWDQALRHYKTDLTTSSDCILLSRVMAEEGFHAHWEVVASDPANPQYAFAKPVIDMRKIVFTKTLERSIWPNTELARGDLAVEVNKLTAEPGKDILVYGGPTLASSLIGAGLIDEFHLFVNPAAVGGGRAMFKDIDSTLHLELMDAKAFSCGLAVLKYARRSS